MSVSVSADTRRRQAEDRGEQAAGISPCLSLSLWVYVLNFSTEQSINLEASPSGVYNDRTAYHHPVSSLTHTHTKRESCRCVLRLTAAAVMGEAAVHAEGTLKLKTGADAFQLPYERKCVLASVATLSLSRIQSQQ